jgi:hypothetical protein
LPISARSIQLPLSTAFIWTALQAALFWPLDIAACRASSASRIKLSAVTRQLQ